MSKYSPLGNYLMQQQKNGVTQVTLTFQQIENIISGKLPASAHTYDAWWANESGVNSRHVQGVDGWFAVGWKVQADLANRVAIFTY